MRNLLAILVLLVLVAGCTFSAISSQKRRMEDCVVRLVGQEVPIDKATETCRKIHENIHTKDLP